jgi:hypothetical protein
MADPTIAELVTYQFGQTERDLSADSNSGWIASKASAIDRAKYDLYYGQEIPEESSMAMLVKYFLADCACMFLMDPVIDWYKSMTRLSDAKEGATITWYNRIDALERLRKRLQARIAEAKEKVSAMAFGLSASGLANVPVTSADGLNKVSIDPFTYARYLYGDYIDVSSVSTEPLELNVERPGT